MALKKGIVGEDGVALSYHRIVSISMIINGITTIEVGSYINQKYRENQLHNESVSSEDVEREIIPPYILPRYYLLPYTDDMTVKKAYEYLKTLPEFEGAEDVLDDEEDMEDINDITE